MYIYVRSLSSSKTSNYVWMDGWMDGWRQGANSSGWVGVRLEGIPGELGRKKAGRRRRRMRSIN